jgi:hypothetical protein
MYLFWLSIAPARGETASGNGWALLLGSVTAPLPFFFGPFIEPGSFGVSRWLEILVDMIAFPALLPFIVYVPLVSWGRASGLTAFALMWIIPQGVAGVILWSGRRDPSLLVLMPLLWTILAVGIPCFIKMILKKRRILLIPAFLGISALPLLSTSAYWAFFSNRPILGFSLAGIAGLPMILNLAVTYSRSINMPLS